MLTVHILGDSSLYRTFNSGVITIFNIYCSPFIEKFDFM